MTPLMIKYICQGISSLRQIIVFYSNFWGYNKERTQFATLTLRVLKK